MTTRRQWIGLSALIPGLALAFMDQTILPVALPTIQTEFSAGNASLQWTVNSYLLAIAVFVLAAGKLSDRIGHRKALILGLLLFAFASILSGLAPSVAWLIAARALQGVGAALLYPAQTALIAVLFPPEKRGKATGILVSISSFFLIVGPLVGGYLTELASWHWIFFVNIPIALIGVPIALYFLPKTPPHAGKIDSSGFLCFAVFASSLTMLLMQGRDWGLSSIAFISLLTLAALLLLYLREKKAAHPFLDITLLKNPLFAAINLSISINQFILMSTVFRAIYFQTVLHYTPIQTGAITFIGCLPVLFFSTIAGFLSDRFGPKVPIALGFALLIFSFFWFGFFPTPNLTFLLIPSIAFGIGIPLIYTPAYSTALSAVPPQKIGVGSGIIATLRTLAATAGVALIGLVLDSVQDSRFLTLGAWSGLSKNELYAISNGSVSTFQESLAPALLQARVDAFSAAHFALGCLLIVVFGAVFHLHKRKSTHHLPPSPAEGWD